MLTVGHGTLEQPALLAEPLAAAGIGYSWEEDLGGRRARVAAVHHLMHDGRLAPHRPTEGVRIAIDRLVYDVGVERPLDLG